MLQEWKYGLFLAEFEGVPRDFGEQFIIPDTVQPPKGFGQNRVKLYAQVSKYLGENADGGAVYAPVILPWREASRPIEIEPLHKVWLYIEREVESDFNRTRGGYDLHFYEGLFVPGWESITLPGTDDWRAILVQFQGGETGWTKIQPARWLPGSVIHRPVASLGQITVLERQAAIGSVASEEFQKSRSQRSLSRIARAASAK